MGVIVRQKTPGKGKPWWVFVSHNCRRTSRKVGKKGAAEEVAGQIQAKLSLGQYDFDKEKTKVPALFKDYADSWIKVTVPATCKASTLKDYEDILRLHVGPVFNDIPITEITRGKIKDFLLGKTKVRPRVRSST